jgi:hypothetical protein
MADLHPSAAPQPLLELLGRIDRRLRLNYSLYDLLFVAGFAVIMLLAWRLLRVYGTVSPVAAALTVLVTILAAAGVLFLVAAHVLRRRFGMARAAVEVDARAQLRNEMLSAWCFTQQPGGSAWIDAHVRRAAATAAGLDPARLVPVHLPVRVLAPVAAGAIALLAVWFVTPLKPAASLAAVPETSVFSEEERKQIVALQALVDKAPQTQTTRKLQQALDTLQRKEAREEEKRRALAQAQEAVEQSKLDAASAREGLYQLAESLRGTRGMEDVARALQEGDARKAAELLERKAGQPLGAKGGAGPSADARQLGGEKDLAKLLQEAAKSRSDGGDAAAPPSVAMKEAVDRLSKIASELEVQGTMSNSTQLLQQLQLSVSQRSTLSAGRFAQQEAQNSSAGSESGNTMMPGGKMFRSAAVAQEAERSQQQEGTRAGDAQGESEAEPLLGQQTQRLEVQLKQEVVQKEGEPGTPASEAWFYAQSKEQKSVLQLQAVQARAAFAQADSTPPEGISVRHRQTVKEYFMNLREGAK